MAPKLQQKSGETLQISAGVLAPTERYLYNTDYTKL